MKKVLLATAIVIGAMWAGGYDIAGVKRALTGWADDNAATALNASDDWG